MAEQHENLPKVSPVFDIRIDEETLNFIITTDERLSFEEFAKEAVSFAKDLSDQFLKDFSAFQRQDFESISDNLYTLDDIEKIFEKYLKSLEN